MIVSARNTKLFIATALTLLLTSCGETNSIFNKANIRAEIADGDLVVQMNTSLNTMSVVTSEVQWPIYNPENYNELLGTLIVATSQNTTTVGLKLNVTKTTKLRRLNQERTLPNGTSFPVQGADTNNWYSLPLGNSTKSKLYVNINTAKPQGIIGYALISDSLSAGIIANIFFPYNNDGLSIYGGIFSGITPGTSGIAVFADITKTIQATTPSFKGSPSTVTFKDKAPKENQDQLMNHILNLSSLKAKVKLK